MKIRSAVRTRLASRRAARSTSGARGARDERGDIAGWVMITVMTLTLAAAITVMFIGAVTDYLQSALDQFM